MTRQPNLYTMFLDLACSCQPLGQRSNHCRSRKSVCGHISVYNIHPVYIPYFLQVLSQLYFTSMTPNKDQVKEQLFYCPFVFDLLPGYVHELRGSRLGACVLCARKNASRKKWHKLLVRLDGLPRFRHQSVDLGQLYNICRNQVFLSSRSRELVDISGL